MGKNLNQVPTQAISILATDKMYIARSPFGPTDDRYILGSDIIAQLASPLTTKGDLYTFTTVDARLPVAVGDGKVLQVASGAATGLAYSTPTYPSASGGLGKILISDGTNNIYSTPAYPNTAGTLGSIIISDGTNLINSTSLWPNTVGTALHLVLSDGTSNVYSTPAYPNASVTAGKLIISDGTNYIASTSIWPNTVGAAGKIIRSDGTVNAYTTSTFADTYLINTIPFAASANTIAGATLSTILDTIAGSAQGDILYRNATNWTVLAPGTAGYFLQTGGAGADISWQPEAGSGTVTSFSAGNLSPLFTTSVANPTTTPALTFSLSNAGANTYFGNGTGISAAPSYTAAGALTKTDDTNVTLTLGGSPITALLQAVSLTLGWTGVLSLARGGTNADLSAQASNGGIVWSNATQMQILGGTATARQMLQSGSTATPAWSTSTWPATTTANQLLYSQFNNVVTGLASAVSSVLVTDGSSVPSFSTTLPSGLTIPGYAASGANSDITSLSGLTGYLQAPLGVKDSNGNIVVKYDHVASAVNYFDITNAATGQSPTIVTAGSDSAIPFGLAVKNSDLLLYDSTSTIAPALRWYNAARTQYVGFKAGTLAASTIWTLPTADGSANFPLTTDGSGQLSLANKIAAGAMATLGGSGMSAIGNTSFDLSTASGGTVTVTGLAFQPSLVIFLCMVNTTATASWGFDKGGGSADCICTRGSTGGYTSVATAIAAVTSAGNSQIGVISAFTSDGFTLTFTKTGSPTGALGIFYLALK